MMAYIRSNGNFHDPNSAWAFHRAHNWYGKGLSGGIFRSPTLIGVGDAPGGERVDVTPLGGGKRVSPFGGRRVFTRNPRLSVESQLAEILAVLEYGQGRPGSYSRWSPGQPPSIQEMRELRKAINRLPGQVGAAVAGALNGVSDRASRSAQYSTR
jgi:hypothetical protein